MAPTSTWILALTACAGPEPEGASGSPSLWVEGALAFDDVEIGSDEPRVETLWVENVGTGLLFVDVPYFAEDGAFSVTSESVSLERMEAYGYEITFDPHTPFLHEGLLIIDSNDPHGRSRWVAVRGEAFAPVLEVASAIDFGATDVGCAARQEIEVWNGGNEVLVVTPSLAGVDPTELFLEAGSDPIEIPPSMVGFIALWYAPADATADSATLSLVSNDPSVLQTIVEVTGAGQGLVTRNDVFEMGPRESDIVLVVDNSESMDTEQAKFVDHVDAFVEGLDAAMVDYHIGVVSTDQSSLYGPVVTSSTPDAAGALAGQVEAMGTGGSGTQRALQMLYQCVEPGNDCSGFLRDDALFVGIIVSDQPDQSALSPERYVEYFWTLKGERELVRVLALAGGIPVPTCASCASSGFGYDEAVEATHGTYVDICTDDWDVALRSLAESSLGEPARVLLSADPLMETIVVEVDGVPWRTGWTYTGQIAYGGTNEIRFDLETAPPRGAEIEVGYTIAPACYYD